MTTLIAAMSTIALAGGLGAALTRSSNRRAQADDQWAAGLLTALCDSSSDSPELGAAPACPICGGRHCSGCQEPLRHTATWLRHTAQHSIADTPPSLAGALALMAPAERARELVRQLGQASWHPWLHLPRLERVRYVAATVAARNGVPMLLGQLAPAGRLP